MFCGSAGSRQRKRIKMEELEREKGIWLERELELERRVQFLQEQVIALKSQNEELKGRLAQDDYWKVLTMDLGYGSS